MVIAFLVPFHKCHDILVYLLTDHFLQLFSLSVTLVKLNSLKCYRRTKCEINNGMSCIGSYRLEKKTTSLFWSTGVFCMTQSNLKIQKTKTGTALNPVKRNWGNQVSTQRDTLWRDNAVASLGLVSPGAATDGVTLFFIEKNWRPFFTALHGMQSRYSDGNSVCLSVCPSVCQTRALWQDERKICPDFYTMRKIIQSSFMRRRMVGWARPLIPEILGQPARVGAKSPILNR